MIRSFFKAIERTLSIQLLSFPVGLTPYIKGLNGRKKILNSSGLREVTTKGYQLIDIDPTKLNIPSLKRKFELLEQNKTSSNQLLLIETSNLRTLCTISQESTIFKNIAVELEKLFDLPIELIEISYYRNYHIPEVERHKLSGDWHFDRRPQDWMRLFILPCAITEDNGPLETTDIETSKKIVRANGYKRASPIYQQIVEKILNKSNTIKLVGNIGQGLLVDTQRVLHRAGVPALDCNRDMIQVIFKPK